MWVCVQPPPEGQLLPFYPLEMIVVALSNISTDDVGGPSFNYRGLFSFLYMPPCFQMTNYHDLVKPDTR